MSSLHFPPWLSQVFRRFAAYLDCRTAARVPLLMLGILLANATRRTTTSWFRAAGIADDFRPAYHCVYAIGCRCDDLAVAAWLTVKPCLPPSRRLVRAIDDT